MAMGFKGFQYTSPEEVITATQQGFQRALQSGDKDTMRAAIAQQAAFALGGNPMLAKARKTEKVLKKASIDAPSTGDELEDQMGFYKNAQKAAVEAELPEIALQATERLSQLRLMQEERGRLKNAEGRAEAEEARQVEEFGMDKKLAGIATSNAARQVLVDPEGEYITTVDVTSDEGLQKLNELREAGQEFTHVSEADWFNALSRENLLDQKVRTDGKGGLPPTTANRFNQLAIGQTTFRSAMDQLVDIIDEAPEGLSAAGKTGAILERLGSQGLQFAAANGQSREEAQEIISGASRRFNVPVERIRGAVVNLAYALASSREGGKLSESDIELALQTLGVNGQPDPAAALTVLRDTVERNANTWQQIPDTIIGFKNAPDAMDVWGKQNNSYQDLMGKFDDKIAKWSDPDKSRGTPPPATSGAEDDLATIFGPVSEQGNGL